MRIIKPESGFGMYKILFSHLQSASSLTTSWQVEDQNKRRRIFTSKLISFDIESKTLFFKFFNNPQIREELPVYIYSEDGEVIFKSKVRKVLDEGFYLDFPSEMKILDDHEITSIKKMVEQKTFDPIRPLSPLEADTSKTVLKTLSERSTRDQDFLNHHFTALTLDEEDKIFSEIRESPRARPKIDKWIKLKVQTTPVVQEARIYDLSRGGISFISMELELFPPGTKLLVLEIDNFKLDDPLIALVMSVRPIDELEIEYKVGCRFEEGQT